MNQNRPFFSTNTNLYNESFRSSAPATLNGQNVILSQEQQRRIYDTLSTAIVGNNCGLNNNCPGNINVLHAQKQFFPGGVAFTFNQQLQSNPQNGPAMCCKCPVPNAVVFDQNNFHSGVNSFFPTATDNKMFCGIKPQGMDYFNYQQQLSKNPFELRFHNDHCTSCSDLLSHFTQVPGSQGYPDLCNISSTSQQVCPDNKCQMPPMLFPSPPIEFSSNARKLVLSKDVTPCCQDRNEITAKRNSFSNVCSGSVARNEKSSQITSHCLCDVRKHKNRSKKTKKDNSYHQCSTDEDSDEEQNDKKQKIRNTDSSDTNSSGSDHNNSESRKPKKKVRWCSNPQNSEESCQSSTSDTESDSYKCNEKGRKKTKKG